MWGCYYDVIMRVICVVGLGLWGWVGGGGGGGVVMVVGRREVSLVFFKYLGSMVRLYTKSTANLDNSEQILPLLFGWINSSRIMSTGM